MRDSSAKILSISKADNGKYPCGNYIPLQDISISRRNQRRCDCEYYYDIYLRNIALLMQREELQSLND